jgi:hypothetical protein
MVATMVFELRPRRDDDLFAAPFVAFALFPVGVAFVHDVCGRRIIWRE